MPSMLSKITRRRRRSSVDINTKIDDQNDRCQPNVDKVLSPGSDGSLPGGLPSSIRVDSDSEAVSPLKAPCIAKKSTASLPSFAFSERTASTLSSSSHDSASDTESVTAPPTDKIIPPRPAKSHWTEEEFLKVIQVWDLSQEEIDKMRELEAKLYDVHHWKNNPFEVVRFMKGPQGYKPAERLFRRMIDWRVANNVDTILGDFTPPPVMLDYCPSAILHGLDHDGDPIYLERAGATDASGLLKRYGHDEMIRYVIWLRELCGRGKWIQDHEERMGRPITQVTIVYDLAGLNSRHLRPGVLPFFGHMMRLTQDYYTGPVKRMVIIRAPAIFRVVWGIVKHFFDPWAVQKMTFTGAHNHEEVLSQFMDLSVLPPVISPEHGRGRAADGMPQRFDGGIPPARDYDEPVSPPPDTTVVKANTPMMMASSSSSSTNSTTTASMDDTASNSSSGGSSAVSASSLGSGVFYLNVHTGDVSVQSCA